MLKENAGLNDYVKAAHENAIEKGFHGSKMRVKSIEDLHAHEGVMIALIMTEAAEALEAHRKGDEDNLAEELADVFIRVADACGIFGIDLEQAVLGKMSRNQKRPKMHGGKRY